MMLNKTAQEASTLLGEIKELLQLNGENQFKVRAFERAAKAVQDQEDLVILAKEGKLTELPGVGKGIAVILTHFLLKNTCPVKEELLAALPRGLIEFIKIPGLGPKKAAAIVNELKIHNLSELEVACHENRLLSLKGMSEKTQRSILEGIQFLKNQQGKQRLSEALPLAHKTQEALEDCLKKTQHLRVCETGALRRRLEVLSEFEFLVEFPADPKEKKQMQDDILKRVEQVRQIEKILLPIRIHETSSERFGYDLVKTTGSAEHWIGLGSPKLISASNEIEFYNSLHLPVIPPEMREGGDELELARQGELNHVLAPDKIQGIFHVHTTRSDGSGSLEEMILAAKKAGYRYIGISDHSQSAFYAQGLKEPDLLSQEKEIRKIQEKYPEIQIFWGIESDILADGSLDYDAQILKRFDFVIASIHSRFKMNKKQMTDRIVKAIRNPATRFIGHLTGRLLLEREGFDLEIETIVSEASQCNVALEINAHPLRLDIDWRHGALLRKFKTRVSVNPDAHSPAGILDTDYGITLARKALLPQNSVVNSWNTKEINQWLKRK